MGMSATGFFVPGSTLRLAWAQSGGWAVNVQTLREDLGDADTVADFRETSIMRFARQVLCLGREDHCSKSS